ncbi:MAG: formylglycine-generating enzyme family protein [Gemmataceae bacterium]
MSQPKQRTENNSPVPKGSGDKPNRSRLYMAGLACLIFIGAVSLLILIPKSPEGMVWIPPGEFFMGDDSDPKKYPDALPIHKVRLKGFYIDVTEVTNAQFRKFVDATNYKTIAEQPLDPKDFPDVPLEKLKPGAGVFSPPKQEVVDCSECNQWWEYKEGVCWKHPEGPNSNLNGKENHPVVYIAWDDAVAYCKWAGKRLPTEAEWEYAARGGLERKAYAWGNDSPFEGKPRANIWQGPFPNRNDKTDGFLLTSPVRTFPPNGYGLYDVSGNVWEWCADWYRPDSYSMPDHLLGPGIPAVNPKGPGTPIDPHGNQSKVRVQRGGSFLCSSNYCVRYRVGLRMHGAQDTGLSHTGFRCVKDP